MKVLDLQCLDWCREPIPINAAREARRMASLVLRSPSKRACGCVCMYVCVFVCVCVCVYLCAVELNENGICVINWDSILSPPRVLKNQEWVTKAPSGGQTMDSKAHGFVSKIGTIQG